MSLIGAVRVVMGLDSAQYESRLRRVTTSTRTSATQITRSFAQMRSGTASLVAGIGAVFSLAAIKRSLDMAASIGEVSEQLGVTTRDLQIYRYAATQVNLAQEEVERSLARLSLNIGRAAHGARQQADAFTVLGISVRDANGRIKTAGEIMPELADAIMRIPSAASRAAILVELFGRAGQRLLPLLKDGAPALRRFAEEAERMGMVLSEGEIANADRTADKIEQLNTALSANLSRVVAQNADSILALATSLSSLAVSIVRFLASNPQAAMALLGGLAGARFGAPGIGIGAGLGAAIGGDMANEADDANMDIAHRGRRLAAAGAELRHRLNTPPSSQGWITVRNRDARSGDTVGSARAELNRQRALFARARAQRASAGGATPAPLDLGNFAASGGGGGGRHGRDAAEEEARAAHEQARELRDMRKDELRVAMDRTQDELVRQDLAAQMLDLENEQYRADLAEAVRRGDLTQTRANERLVARVSLEEAQRAAAGATRLRTLQDEEVELADQRFELQSAALRDEVEAASTAAERRTAELRLLDLTYEHQRAKLDAILADTNATAQAQRRAQQERDTLDASHGRARAGVIRSTMGPMESFLASLPSNAAKMNEALEQVAAQGLGNLVDGLAEAVTHIRSLGDAFKIFRNIAMQSLQDVIRVMLQRGLANLLSSMQSGGPSASGKSGGFDPIAMVASFASKSGKLPGLAGGGSIRIGGMAGVDRNLLRINMTPVARVGMGETIDITPAGGRRGGGGSSFHFDLRGAVVTQDLIAQMNAIGANAALAGSGMAQQALYKRAGRRLGRSR